MATKKSGGKKTAAKTTKTSKSSSAGKGADPVVVKRAKSTNWMAIFESLVIGVLGVLLITNPTWITQTIFYVIGIFLIVKGVYKVVNYFAARGKYDFYNNDLLYGVIALVFGILVVILWEKLSNAIGIVAGAWMIYGALVRMNCAIKLHTAENKDWFYVLLLSLLMLALGIYLIISAGAGVINIVGWIMLAAAVVGIVNDTMFMKHIETVKK